MDKKSTYHTNGSGRDMYIFSTNGGFLKNKPQTFNFDPMNYHHQPSRSTLNLHSITSKAIHYRNDGTGRDTYIKTDEGGYSPFNSESPKKLEFINSLRGYQPKKPCPSNDFFSKSQFILPIAEILKANKKVKTQKIATERLTNISKSTVVRLPRII